MWADLGRIALVSLIVVIPSGVQASKQAPGAITKSQEIARLGWEFRAGQYKLPRSSGTLNLLPGLAMVRGEKARRMVLLAQGQDFPEVEAVLVDPRTASGIILTYLDSGYVRIDDWARINNSRLLERIRQVTAESNRLKSETGLSPVTIKGWMQPPTLDRQSNSVSWAIEAADGTTPIVNAVTLKLGKNGFEKLTWVGKRDLYFAKKGLLEDIRDSLEFSPGQRYSDFSQGDPQAEFGISTLVAAAAGAGPPMPDDIGAGLWSLLAALAARPWGMALLAGMAVVILLPPVLILRRRRG